MLISVCCQIWFLIVYSSFNTNEHHTDVLPLSLSDCTTQRMSVFGLSSSVVTLFNSLCHWMCWSVNDCTLSPPGGGSLYEWAPPIQVWCCQVGWSWLCTGQAVDDFFFYFGNKHLLWFVFPGCHRVCNILFSSFVSVDLLNKHNSQHE